uniref:Uncharacterized protein n=1 Tax=Pyxicephalus adspersus TaxID=30357 RepID=A0AAV3B0E0_PYXAD|nr:TPA: hypothetical protein GDO54_001349 [Pyxicephalus adspersus]
MKHTLYHPIYKICAFADSNSFRHITSSANRPAHVPPQRFCKLCNTQTRWLKAQNILKCSPTAQDAWCLVRFFKILSLGADWLLDVPVFYSRCT